MLLYAGREYVHSLMDECTCCIDYSDEDVEMNVV